MLSLTILVYAAARLGTIVSDSRWSDLVLWVPFLALIVWLFARDYGPGGDGRRAARRSAKARATLDPERERAYERQERWRSGSR